jgi:hypothetical protein
LNLVNELIIHKNHYSFGFFIKTWTAFQEKWILDFSLGFLDYAWFFNKIKGQQQVNWINSFGL